MNDIIVSSHAVRTQRLARRWSQAELAERAGISRAAVSAIEGQRLSPSVATALALAAVFECSVEELFGRPKTVAAGPEWAWQPPTEASRYWEASVNHQRRLYPVEATGLNPAPHDGVWQNGVLREGGPSPADATLVMACCDPAAGLLAAEYAHESGFRLLVFPRGGRTALELLRQGLVHVAGLHYSTTERPQRNAEMVRAQMQSDCRLLRAGEWEEGIALSREDRTRSVAAITRRPLQWAARESGSAARECLEELLKGRRFAGREVGGHASVAEAVRSGWAGAGICVRLSAEEAGLNFLPLRRETLDLCFPAAWQHDPRLQALVRLLRSRTHRRLLSDLPGYDARHTGELTSIFTTNPDQTN